MPTDWLCRKALAGKEYELKKRKKNGTSKGRTRNQEGGKLVGKQKGKKRREGGQRRRRGSKGCNLRNRGKTLSWRGRGPRTHDNLKRDTLRKKEGKSPEPAKGSQLQQMLGAEAAKGSFNTKKLSREEKKKRALDLGAVKEEKDQAEAERNSEKKKPRAERKV